MRVRQRQISYDIASMQKIIQRNLSTKQNQIQRMNLCLPAGRAGRDIVGVWNGDVHTAIF